MLLIVTSKHELASDYLILRLRERNIPFVRFNTEDLGCDVDIEVFCNSDGGKFILYSGKDKILSSSSPVGVYLHHPSAPIGTLDVVEGQRAFGERELLELLRSLWRLIPEHRWLNHPVRLWQASNKIEQLLTATHAGLEIPDTLITRSPQSVQKFLDKHGGKVIIKAIRHGFLVEKDEMLLAGTQQVPTDFPKLMQEYAAVPSMFQESIPKGLDLRIVVVQDQVFAVTIEAPIEIVDWRIADIAGHPLKYELTSLPPDIERACIRVVRQFGLRYSSIDMIRARDGRFVFLELNPSGQWAWLEQNTGCQIRDAIIDALVSTVAQYGAR